MQSYVPSGYYSHAGYFSGVPGCDQVNQTWGMQGSRGEYKSHDFSLVDCIVSPCVLILDSLYYSR